MVCQSPIAVVAMDGIFPGAPDLDAFWYNIVNKIDQSAPVPADRWIAPASDRLRKSLRPDRTYSRHACLIHDFSFEPDLFALDADLTRQLDPVYQLTLTAAKRAVKGCATAHINLDRVDVLLAAIALPTDSASAFTRKILGQAIAARLFPVNRQSYKPVSRMEALVSRVDGLPAALLAAEMGFGGNCLTLDAACASSLYAVKLACDALVANRCDMAVSGGVSRPECLYTQTGFSQLQALSPSGRCAPFDRKADGLVVGEGVGIVVLKRLADALDQGDVIHGIVRGIGLSNDMRGNLLAPESAGQVRAMRQAYEMAGWRPSDVDLIECHGTGTPAGDTTEINSLVQLWGQEANPRANCAIGSVKSMIGHLLTAAGAAGMIKTLLAMRHQTLPPSLHFEQPPMNSPLADSPFSVQTTPAPWPRNASDMPRRAAVSAFGFGGFNAHLLFEQWCDPKKPGTAPSLDWMANARPQGTSPQPVAIVGMETTLGSMDGLNALKTALLSGSDGVTARPSGRWKNVDETIVAQLSGFDPPGTYMDHLTVEVGKFQIPPNEIQDILPQQLLALKVGAGALADAGMPLRKMRKRMGVVVGIEFDLEATNYHLRWQLADAVARWNATKGMGLTQAAIDRWLETLRDQCGPPLTPSRVLGALGGIVASRMAREFRFGGPSFVVSANTASGVQALQVAVDQLQQGTVKAMLVGAVDLAGEGRSVIRLDRLLGLSRSRQIRPFDDAADGTLPGEGAVALVLKRLDLAEADNDRIYAVIRGIGSACGGNPQNASMDPAVYLRSLSRCCSRAGIAKNSVSFVETSGSGIPEPDRVELAVLADFFTQGPTADAKKAIALGASSPLCGHTGAAHGLVGVAKTALCLYHRWLPPLLGFRQSSHPAMQSPIFHIPTRCQPWYRDHVTGPRFAVTAIATQDGACNHLLLQEAPTKNVREAGFSSPARLDPWPGLFVLSGKDEADLSCALSKLEKLLTKHPGEATIQSAAAEWMRKSRFDTRGQRAVALVLQPGEDPRPRLAEARKALETGGVPKGTNAVFYCKHPLGADTRIAMVYPGSGNHYISMGRELALRFPEVVERMDQETQRLKTQFRPWHLMPWRRCWQTDWETEASAKLTLDPLNMIFGQVVFGSLMTRVLEQFAIPTNAVIGYSLGESSALFAQGVWADRGDMLDRMEQTDLFTTQLAGPCRSLRKAWRLWPETAVNWRVAVVNRPAGAVRKTLVTLPHARLLIVNSPDECVIGGLASAVQQAISAMACQAVYLEGVITVHCDAALPVAGAYRDLHRFPVFPRSGLDVYSCGWAKTYPVTTEAIADSIRQQAIEGFDFTKTIQRAADDGIGVFIEAGPRASCTRMIGRILADRPHVAVAANPGGESEVSSLLRCLAQLAAERVPMNLQPLYPVTEPVKTALLSPPVTAIAVPIGGAALQPTPAQNGFEDGQATHLIQQEPPQPSASKTPPSDAVRESEPAVPPTADPFNADQWKTLIDQTQRQVEATAAAHQRFLELSGDMTRAYAETVDFHHQLLRGGARSQAPASVRQDPAGRSRGRPVAYDRTQCLTFAVGKVGDVFGPAFDTVDRYRVRVRLPDEPLMLVDRILSVQGKMLSMGSGTIVTEHDVHPGAWYLDGDRAPVCISVEAGQADLFLCSYLGIDHQVKGKRAYRLLDAVVTFHRGLPRPDDVIRYEITIDRFVRQGEIWMFFFRFEGFIGDQHLITMHDGCAGFFSQSEMIRSGGILLTKQDRRPVSKNRTRRWRPPVPMERTSYTDQQVDALRKGDLAGCFGTRFAGIRLAESLRLPDGRMRLIHRIIALNPQGGHYGLGMIRAEADIYPDDWFLTCHFVDDKVMPGTLMYECCAHTLRVFLQRAGWVTDKPGVCYEPLIGNEARLKCRGPVTPATKHVHYELQISEIGYQPEPYAIADAYMYADGRLIVLFTNMSMKMTGVHQREIEALWSANDNECQQATADKPVGPLYDKSSILAFAVGKPSAAFGESYRVFDRERKIARLPGPPYCFLDRVILAEPEPWMLKPDGWVTAQYDVPSNEWYFVADRSGMMPFCVLLEIALQPCGWLAAYAGSALRSQRDLKFRNLGGEGILHRNVAPDIGTLTVRCRMTKVSEAADMIIEHFDFEVLSGAEAVYTGKTYFGFFTTAALGQQKGLGNGDPLVQSMDRWLACQEGSTSLSVEPPHTPQEAAETPFCPEGLSLPAKALLMIDRIEALVLPSSAEKETYLRGVKRVDPDEWFFKAHFYQDPVCPGSLGIESFLQLLKIAALKRWPGLAATHHFCLVEGSRHTWSYRGQVIPTNKKVVVQARIKAFEDGPVPQLRGEGLLSVDDLPIYKMEAFELALVPRVLLEEKGLHRG